jgi:hypothetical protein
MADHAKAPRIVVITETDPKKSATKQAEWLAQHYPGHKTIQMANVNQNNRVYNRVTFLTANGQRKVVLFDVTVLFQENMTTSMGNFPVGTMVRLWPGTGSTPTRIQQVQ